METDFPVVLIVFSQPELFQFYFLKQKVLISWKFILNFQAIGEFVLTDPDMKIKPRGSIYSLNEGYESSFDEKLKKYLHSLKHPKVGFISQIIVLYWL